ncbi:MAG: aminoacetone oxidase family FAD-binding enzyme [Elusimicrobia bacterium]|jgi:predicted Rossmann fold flavoprotein|nr:aminoacetone oxidase family FAD-binding enzyme [Elusimicrobiota bacterium]
MTLQGLTVLVVGGGAAGMMAALVAAERGGRVVVLERLGQPGKKILLTGNGRCNITNTRLESAFYHGAPFSFTDRVLRSFPPPLTMEFFKSLGLVCVEEEGGRVYPSCGQASAVLSVLRFEMERRNVQVHCGAEVRRLSSDEKTFKAETKDGRSFLADRVIVAAGGKAYPQLGSDGSGFDLLAALGHRVIPPFPVLVQLNLQGSFLKEVDGVRFNGGAAVVSHGQVMREEVGEIQLTSYGASGIPIMDLSRAAGECLRDKRPAHLELRLLPNRAPQDILADVQNRISSRHDETLERALVGIVHNKIIPVLIQMAGFKNRHVACRQAPAQNVENLAGLLNRWSFLITGTQAWDRAHATAGGVDSTEIDPGTLRSKIVPGLFLAGEVVDVDGDCGGFNLQWAWSSGYVAGLHAATP